MSRHQNTDSILTEFKHFNCDSYNKKNEWILFMNYLQPSLCECTPLQKRKENLSRAPYMTEQSRQVFFSFLRVSLGKEWCLFVHSLLVDWQSRIRHRARKADENVTWPASWKQRGSQNESGKSKDWYVSFSDVIHHTSRMTVAVATAWVRGWHQRHKLSDRLWKDLIPLCYCSPG